MLKICIEMASNGIIKTVTDDNANGGGDSFEERKVYDLENDDENFKSTVSFFGELVEDLGISTGNNFSKNIITYKIQWGDSYEPTEQEVKLKILDHELEILELKKYLNDE